MDINLISAVFALVLLKSISFNPSHGFQRGVILVGSHFAFGLSATAKLRNASENALSKSGFANDASGIPLAFVLQKRY